MNKTKRVSLMKRRKRSNKLQIKTRLENPVIKTRTPARTNRNEIVETVAKVKKPAATKKSATTKKTTAKTTAAKTTAAKKTTKKESTDKS